MTRVLPHLIANLNKPGMLPEKAALLLNSLEDNTDALKRFGEVTVLLSEEHAGLVRGKKASNWQLEIGGDSVTAMNRASDAGIRAGADLVVLDGAFAPSALSIATLQRLFERDPYIAFIAPRISSESPGLIRKLDQSVGDDEIVLIPAEAIEKSNDYYLVPHYCSSCMIIRSSALRDFLGFDSNAKTIRGAILELLVRARRAGFRSAISNRATVYAPESGETTSNERDAWHEDQTWIREKYPELDGLESAWANLRVHDEECLRGRAASKSATLRKSLLIDLCDLGALPNGTSEATLGILGGLHRDPMDWAISLLVHPDVASAHEMQSRFPQFQRCWPTPAGQFTAGFRPIQPWSIDDILRLHRYSFFNFVLMFDTIMDDINYVAPSGLSEVWRFLAQHADGLVYISKFTQERFRKRYPLAPSVDELVSYLSLDPTDYQQTECVSAEDSYLYVVGNSYPHKWMEPTIKDLASAFPFQEFRALGYDNDSIPQLKGYASGNLSDDEVDELFCRARAIIYPSQYEGFGFPMIKGLSLGKTVIVRQSALVDELADIYRGPGRLVVFDSIEELVEVVGQLLHGRALRTKPLGRALAEGEAPLSWDAVAHRIISFIEERSGKPDSSNWSGREDIVRAAGLIAARPSEVA